MTRRRQVVVVDRAEIWRGLMTVYILVLLTSVCCNAPTRPSPGMVPLTITPDVKVLRVGERQLYTASIPTATPQTVVASWTSSDDSIVTIDPSGSAEARGFGEAKISANAVGQTALLDLQVVPNVQGGWSGPMRVDTCGSNGGGSNPCRLFFGLSSSLDLQVTQNHDKVTGTLALFSSSMRGPVTGNVSTDGTVKVTGDLSDGEGGTATITQWQSQFNTVTRRAEGHCEITYRYTNIAGPQVLTISFQFTVTGQTESR